MANNQHHSQHDLVVFSNFKYRDFVGDFVSGQLLDHSQLDDKRNRVSSTFKCYLSYVFFIRHHLSSSHH